MPRLYFSKVDFTREDAERELAFVKSEFKADEDEIVFGHGDGWWPNMIYNKEKGKNN